jgi:hypothetical protein
LRSKVRTSAPVEIFTAEIKTEIPTEKGRAVHAEMKKARIPSSKPGGALLIAEFPRKKAPEESYIIAQKTWNLGRCQGSLLMPFNVPTTEQKPRVQPSYLELLHYYP